MDGERFDTLTRSIARATSRRGVLRGAVAGVLGGALGVRRAAPRVAAQACVAAGGECETGDDCCSGLCSAQGICYCVDPDRPGVGCPCTTGAEAPCGDSTLLCCATTNEPGGPGVCRSGSVGCQPVGCSGAGDPCGNDDDCCAGQCSSEGFCFCEDPAEPARGCPCTTGTQNPCGAETLLCCPTGAELGGDGICTPDRLGCDPIGDGDGDAGDDDAGGDDESSGGDAGSGTTLPSTGTGSGAATDRGGLLTALAATGAVAAVAARRRRRGVEAAG